MKILKRISYFIVIAALVTASFFSGSYYKSLSLGNYPKNEVIAPLELQTSGGGEGLIPAGAVLYDYSHSGEVDTYILFVNLYGGYNTSLTPYPDEGKFNLIVPIDAETVRQKN